MRKFVVALLAVGLIAPATAGAHNSRGWYWGEGRAEAHLIAKWTVDDLAIDDAVCSGYGRRYKGLYKHFDCYVDLEDGSIEQVEVHVTGRRSSRVYVV